ncbi:oxidative damage protection protein [Candidatus Hoaglandella endobia]|nr:oxidative damage protection protein [Candidatus Hoaglandella endobia]
MSKVIYCKFLKREAEGQDFQIYPGELGKKIFQDFSKEAWMQWQTKQTMLINEKKLSMVNADDRKFLEQKMIDFLFEDQELNRNKKDE